MATAVSLDFDALLAPISEEFPSGQSRKDNPAVAASLTALKAVQDKASEDERKIRVNALAGEPDEQAALPGWDEVLEKAESHLREQAKDIRVGVSLITAIMRERGYAGLRDGLRLMREMVERFWDTIHPRPEEADEDDDVKGLAFTVERLTQINSNEGRFSFQWEVRNLPITTDGHSLNTLISAEQLEKITDPDKKQEEMSRGRVGMDALRQSLRETTTPNLRNLVEDIQQALEELKLLGTLLDDRCGREISPSLGTLRETLEDSLTRIKFLAGDRLADAAADEAGAEGGGTAAEGAGGAIGAPGSVGSREKAFELLLQVSQYFRKAEPHSPVSYALEQAVRWGRMPLPQLLLELIADETTRTELSRRTGVPLTPPEGS